MIIAHELLKKILYTSFKKSLNQFLRGSICNPLNKMSCKSVRLIFNKSKFEDKYLKRKKESVPFLKTCKNKFLAQSVLSSCNALLFFQYLHNFISSLVLLMPYLMHFIMCFLSAVYSQIHTN